jgi:hypothetical protein
LSFYFVFIVNSKDIQRHCHKLYLLNIIKNNKFARVEPASACGQPLYRSGGTLRVDRQPHVTFQGGVESYRHHTCSKIHSGVARASISFPPFFSFSQPRFLCQPLKIQEQSFNLLILHNLFFLFLL